MQFTRFVIYISFLLSASIDLCSTEKMETYAISVSNFKIANDEKIVSFSISLTAAAMQSVENIPVGWYLIVNNDASWQTYIKANTMLGSASLTLDELKNIRLIVKKNEFMDLKFGVSRVISLTKDFEKERQALLKMNDFAVIALK